MRVIRRCEMMTVFFRAAYTDRALFASLAGHAQLDWFFGYPYNS